MSPTMHNLGKIPEGLDFNHSSVSSLGDFDASELQSAGVDEAWYWYSTGSYEGSGQMIYRKGEKYGLHDMSHCSCYGPCERLSLSTPLYNSLGDLKAACSLELWNQVVALVQLANRGI